MQDNAVIGDKRNQAAAAEELMSMFVPRVNAALGGRR
jgi:hypothetical protein